MRFPDRRSAGRRLAEELRKERFSDPVVLALPRGGVPVAFEVARKLHAPLEVFVSRKLGAPGRPEFGFGAIAEGGAQVLDQNAVAMLGLSDSQIEALVLAEQHELQRRIHEYRGDRELPELSGREVILVDDGLATGVTAEAALRSLRNHEPGRLVLAVPVCARETQARLSEVADLVVYVHAPSEFIAVGPWYEDFSQTTDQQVHELLALSSHAGTT